MASTFDNFFRELQFGRLEKPVKAHLRNVYAAMGIALLACAIGGYVNLFTTFMPSGILTSLGAFGLLLCLVFTRTNNENIPMRFGLLTGFAFLTGVNLGPLLDIAIEVDPTIVATAFLATSLIFIGFTLSALLSSDRKWLALGGVLFSGLFWLLLLGMFNIFFGSQLLFQVYVYLGLAIMCGFVLYDTQLIVEKRRNGDEDFIMHCVDLFLDFINIFRFLVVLLTDKEGRRDKRRRN